LGSQLWTKETLAKIFRGMFVVTLECGKHSLKRFIGVLNPKVLEGILFIKKTSW
jgi:hypothetical protein